MPTRFDRKPTLLDAMIVVAATAVGLACFRPVPPLFYSGPHVWALSVLVADVTALLAPWTVALLVIRLLPPRPRLRRLARQPGFVACAVSVMDLIANVDFVLARLAAWRSHLP